MRFRDDALRKRKSELHFYRRLEHQVVEKLTHKHVSVVSEFIEDFGIIIFLHFLLADDFGSIFIELLPHQQLQETIAVNDKITQNVEECFA